MQPTIGWRSHHQYWPLRVLRQRQAQWLTVTVMVPAGEPAPDEVTFPVMVKLLPGLAGLGLMVVVMVGGAPVTSSVSEGRVDGPAKPGPGMNTNVTLAGPTCAQQQQWLRASG